MKNRKKGFTLIELIVALAVMSIFAVVLSSVLSSTLKSNGRQTDKLALQDNATVVQRAMKNDIQKAKTITVPETPPASLSGYTSILYIETIAGKKMYYAFKDGQVWKINLNDESTVSSIVSLGKFINSFSVNKTGRYCDVKLNLIKNSSYLELNFRVAQVSFGGDL